MTKTSRTPRNPVCYKHKMPLTKIELSRTTYVGPHKYAYYCPICFKAKKDN